MNNDKALNELLNKIREKECQALLHIMQRLENYRQKCNWDSLCSLLLISGQNSLRIAFPLYYKLIPDNMKYDLVVSAYTHNEDHVPAVQKALRHARRYGSPVFPQELSQQDVFTVYRGGTEAIEKSKYRISWSISQDTALWFWQRHLYFGHLASHLYKAKIKRENVIAYTDRRGEKEIMQYRNVFDIEDITPDNFNLKS